MHNPSSPAGPPEAAHPEISPDLAPDSNADRLAPAQRGLSHLVLEKLKLEPGNIVLEVGRSPGQYLAQMSNIVGMMGSAKGVDLDPEAVSKASTGGPKIELAPAGKLSDATATVDALACDYSLYYVENLQAILDEFGRVCKKGARLVITGPSKDTNRELYEFHRKATKAEPGQSDKELLGFVQGPVAASLAHAGFGRTAIDEFADPMTFADKDAFLDFWQSTELYAHTGHAIRQLGEEILAGKTPPFIITKRISVLSAVKAR